MFPLVASSSGGFPEHGSGLYPLVILLLMVGWGVFVVCAGERLVRLFREGLQSRDGAAVAGGRMSSAALLLVLIVAAVAALWASPLPPVLSTYTGFMHVSSAEQVASLDWHGGFPADYPLATPVFASFV
ncbi:MAG: hypothetical protein FJ109_21980, partial [Deltaproteobacteria bacterium]|nr:hypothetical protein [Deltaproteobacteria bacterium]